MRYVAIMLFFACFSACNSENKKEPNEYEDFVAQIKAIDAIGKLDDSSYNMYFENPKLKSIFLDSDKWASFNQRIWRDKGVDVSVKILSVQLTQCLSHDSYLKSLNQAYKDFLAGNVTEKIIEKLIIPSPEWSTWLATNYRDKEIEMALKEIYDNPGSSVRIKNAVDQVLSGKEFEYIKANNEGDWPRIACVRNK